MKSGGYYRQVVHILDKNLNVLNKKILDADEEVDSYTWTRKPAIHGSKFYIAGWEAKPGSMDYRWVVYVLEITGITIREAARAEKNTSTTALTQAIPSTPIVAPAIAIALTVIINFIVFRKR